MFFVQNMISNIVPTGPDPEHSNTGGHRMPRQDVSGVSLKGGEYERGSPLSFRGPGGSPPGKIWEIVVPEKRFKACFRSKCLVSNLILKASLTICNILCNILLQF